MTILTGENYKNNYIEQFVKIKSHLFLINFFCIFTHVIKFYKFHCLILNSADASSMLYYQITRNKKFASLQQTLRENVRAQTIVPWAQIYYPLSIIFFNDHFQKSSVSLKKDVLKKKMKRWHIFILQKIYLKILLKQYYNDTIIIYERNGLVQYRKVVKVQYTYSIIIIIYL